MKLFSHRFLLPALPACQGAALTLLLASGFALTSVPAQAQGLQAPRGATAPALDAPAPAGRQAERPRPADYVVAMVNAEPVTNNEVRERALRLSQQAALQGDEPRPAEVMLQMALEMLIDERLQMQVAEQAKIKIDAVAIAQAEQRVAAQNRMSLDEVLKRLQGDGISRWRLQEFATFLFAAIIITCIALDILPYRALILWYVIGMFIFFLNSLRTLAAHAYRNPGEHKMEFAEQYLDSINVPGNLFITGLWAPVGLRYHATHHLFMSMPYHNLGKAQRRLVNGLSDNTLYLQTVRKGLWDALRRIWSEASAATR